jgi:hypothetical protein
MAWPKAASTTVARRWRPILFVALVIIFMGLSIPSARRQRAGTDFHVFWVVGRNFTEGAPLYEAADGAGPCVYPPFAATLF